MREAVAFATILAMLYEILYRQTYNRLYCAARKIFIVIAAIGIVIEIARIT